MINKLMSALVCGVCACGTGVTNADDFVSFAPLVGDFDATNPGLEAAVPTFKYFDVNPVDGYMESFGVRFDVYNAGTKTLRYSTAWRYFNLPALPAGCSAPTSLNDYELSPKFLRRSDTTRIHMGINYGMSCSNGSNWVEKRNSGIYSADVSSSSGTTWVYKLAGIGLDGFEGIDTNNDGVNDTLLVTHGYETQTPAGFNVYILGLNPATGAVSVPAVTYPVVR
jgi:hypothetical protein